MKYKTYKEWKRSFYYVRRGEKSHSRNKKGEPLFSEEQVIAKFNVVDDDRPYTDSYQESKLVRGFTPSSGYFYYWD